MLTVATAALCAILGAVAAGFGAEIYAKAYRIPSSDVGMAYMTLLVLIPAGALAGLIIGTVSARAGRARGTIQGTIRGTNRGTIRGFAGFLRAIVIGAVATLGGIGGITGALLLLAPTRPPDIDGRWLFLEYEIRLPAGQPLPSEQSGWTATLSAPSIAGQHLPTTVTWNEARSEAGRPVVPGSGYVYSAETGRRLIVRNGQGGETSFTLALAERPTRADMEWTPWQAAPDGTEIRTRVQLGPKL